MSYLLVIINIIIFIIVNLLIGQGSQYDFALNVEYVKVNHEWWRLLSAMFLHADVMHLAMNMLALVFYGLFFEKYFPTWLFLLIYFGSGILGGVFSVLIYSTSVIALGASGAIFGLFGFDFWFLIQTNRRYVYYGLIYLFASISQSFSPGIGTWAHLTGLFIGMLIGYYWKKNN